MSATYRVLIEPDEDKNDAILEILLELGYTEEQAEKILELGGTVAEHLERDEAEDLRDHLEDSGAIPRIEPMDAPQPEEPDTSIIVGIVEGAGGNQLSDLTVRAFDVDLRSEHLLGVATTDEQGYYEIEYDAGRSGETEYGRPDVALRVYNASDDRLEIEASEGERVDGEWIVFNAEPRVEIDLVVSTDGDTGSTEFELLLREYLAAADGVSPADATERDVEFLFHELDTQRGRLDTLAASGRIARELGLPIEAIYGWLRVDGPDDPERLWKFSADDFLEIDPDDLSSVLEEAIERAIIPAFSDDSLADLNVRFRRLHEEARITIRKTVTGRLVEAESDQPLAGYTVRLLDTTSDTTPRQWRDRLGRIGRLFGTPSRTSPISPDVDPGRVVGDFGEQVTDASGRISVPFALPDGASMTRTLRIQVRSPTGEELKLEEPEIEIGLEDEEEFRVKIALPKPGGVELADPELREALDGATIDDKEVDPDRLGAVLSYLDESMNITTLADIRSAGGLAAIIDELDEPPVPTDDSVVDVVDAHVTLSLLPSSIETNARLIDRGFSHPLEIASVAQEQFVTAVTGESELEPVEAARLHAASTAHTAVLDNVLALSLTTRVVAPGGGD